MSHLWANLIEMGRTQTVTLWRITRKVLDSKKRLQLDTPRGSEEEKNRESLEVIQKFTFVFSLHVFFEMLVIYGAPFGTSTKQHTTNVKYSRP